MTTKDDLFKVVNYKDWMESNCWLDCPKTGEITIPGSSKCEIFETIHHTPNGQAISEEILERFGFVEPAKPFEPYEDCPEWEGAG